MNATNTEQPAVASGGTYTSAEVSTRIRVYIIIASLGSLSSSLTDLASMTDDQLRAVSAIRWALKLALLGIGAAIAGYTAFRAAIDRSTAGGNGAAITADTANNNPSAPV